MSTPMANDLLLTGLSYTGSEQILKSVMRTMSVLTRSFLQWFVMLQFHSPFPVFQALHFF